MFFIVLTSKVIKTEVRVSLLVFLDPSRVKLMLLCVGWAFFSDSFIIIVSFVITMWKVYYLTLG